MTEENDSAAVQDAAQDADRPSDAERVATLFTRSGAAEAGGFRFARWGRALAPAVFGTDEQGQAIMTAGFEEAAEIAGVEIVDDDPDFEKNLLVFFCSDWSELAQTPGLGRLIPDLEALIAKLAEAGANQYRIFSFDAQGGIQLAIVLLRYDADLSSVSPQALALNQATQTLLLWSDAAFAAESPTALESSGRGVLKPWYAALLKAAYAEDVPVASAESSAAETIAKAMVPEQAAA